jgi:hypothetical protein
LPPLFLKERGKAACGLGGEFGIFIENELYYIRKFNFY